MCVLPEAVPRRGARLRTAASGRSDEIKPPPPAPVDAVPVIGRERLKVRMEIDLIKFIGRRQRRIRFASCRTLILAFLNNPQSYLTMQNSQGSYEKIILTISSLVAILAAGFLSLNLKGFEDESWYGAGHVPQ
jgi:hypothetical protein